jgi:hypothetical protein
MKNKMAFIDLTLSLLLLTQLNYFFKLSQEWVYKELYDLKNYFEIVDILHNS